MNLTAEERDYLLELLANAHAEMLHELHHSDTGKFEKVLKQRIAMNELLQLQLRKAA